jgi:carbamate kinase
VLIVVALGGNALQPLDAHGGAVLGHGVEAGPVAAAARAVASLARAHDVVVTHGNGPQVGLLAMQAATGGGAPLDVLDAESEGLIGYALDQAIGNERPGREVATLLTQVVVDDEDPAYAAPTKPIGPRYPEDEARALAESRGWTVAPDGPGWRRVVASPEPREVVELGTIEVLLDGNVLVVCAGGGGIPVVLGDGGTLRGVEAVVDKDATAALLATELAADHLMLLTDVPGVLLGYGSADERLVRRADPDALRALALPAGSMGPKVEAACRFVEATGREATIGALADAAAVLAGDSGTRVTLHTAGLEIASPVRPGALSN